MGEFLKKFIFLVSLVILISGCVQEEGTAVEIQSVASNKTYTLAEVAKHNSSNDCWIVFDNKVYDVTKFIPIHPGGRAILQGCGTDATKLFETRPMGSGTPHSQDARNKRETYKIGEKG